MQSSYCVMLLAAGFGKRLLPVTKSVPKPAIDVAGFPLIAYTIALLKKYGFDHFVVNGHHLASELRTCLTRFYGVKIDFLVEPQIFGTAGGVLNVVQKLGLKKDLLVVNSDVITDFDLAAFLKFHHQNQPWASLILKDDERKQKFTPVFYQKKEKTILQFGTQQNKSLLLQKKNTSFGFFTGIQIISQKAFAFLPSQKPSCLVRDFYQKLIEAKKPLYAWEHPGYWNDLGHLVELKKTSQWIQANKISLTYLDELKRLFV